MPDSNEKPVFRKDSSDSGDEADIPKDRKSSDGSNSRGREVLEQPTSSEASSSSSAQPEGAVGGVGTFSGLGAESQPTSVASNWHPCSDSAALISGGACDYTETSGKKPGIVKKIKSILKKISPKKSQTEQKVKVFPGMVLFEDIKGLEPTSSNFQPYSKTTYDGSSIKSIEDNTETAEVNSMAEIVSIPPDSTHASPLNKKPDNDEGTPKNSRKFDDEKADDDDKAKRT